jgi:hypothetical protein
MPIKFNKETSTRLFRYVKSVDIKFNRKSIYGCRTTRSKWSISDSSAYTLPRQAFDSRTKSAREIWRQMHAKRFQDANPNLKINTDVTSTPHAPEVIFKFIDDSEVRHAWTSIRSTGTAIALSSYKFLCIGHTRSGLIARVSRPTRSCLMCIWSWIGWIMNLK